MIKHLDAAVMDALEARFAFLYGPQQATRCLQRLAMLVGRYGVGWDQSPGTPDWSPGDALLITYGDMVTKPGEIPLRTLKRFADQQLTRAFNTIHVLPFFPYSSDDGFSVIHYRKVNPALGQWADMTALGSSFRLMFDLVLNHTSRQSNWFQDYTLGIEPQRHYFVEGDDSWDIHQVVRPRTSPLFTPVNTRMGTRNVWTTFSADQVDLNFAHPDVLFEFLDLILFYLLQGARMFRLDAIAFLWKRSGTPCLHLPETHEVVRVFRDLLRLIAPDAILLTETNVPHDENISYFGTGDEAQMVYQFSLPPLLLHALLEGDASVLNHWAAHLSETPPGCAFLNFTASHDGVGLRPLQGLVPDETLAKLADRVSQVGGRVSMRTGLNGQPSPYELNVTYYAALQDADPEIHLQRFLCSQLAPMALRGIPAVYFNSLLAAPNDEVGVARSGHARAINRKKWDEAEVDSLLSDTTSHARRTLDTLTGTLKERARHAAFHPMAPQKIDESDPRLFVVERTALDGSEHVRCLHNVTREPADTPIKQAGIDLLSGQSVSKGTLTLPPYGCAWICEGG